MPRTLIVLVLFAWILSGQSNSQQRAAWNKPVEPFRIIGNIYYVGVAGVSSFLIVTPQGDFLLDGGLPETAPLIERNISKLGFRLGDVKYLLNSHAHYDHTGGLAELKRKSGATFVASKQDAPALTAGEIRAPGISVDRTIGDGEALRLGDTVMTAHITPGHTKGATTWTMVARDNGRSYNVLFYSSTSVVDRLVNNREYPNIVADYERTFATVRKLPCDVFLGPHGNFFHLEEKRERLVKGDKTAFVDPAEFAKFVDESEQEFRRELQQQQQTVSAGRR